MTPKKLPDDEFGKDLVVSGEHQGGSVRVVKESDSKSDGLCPHRFESCGPRSFMFSLNIQLISILICALNEVSSTHFLFLNSR